MVIPLYRLMKLQFLKKLFLYFLYRHTTFQAEPRNSRPLGFAAMQMPMQPAIQT